MKINMSSTVPELPSDPKIMNGSEIPLFITVNMSQSGEVYDCDIIRCEHCKSYLNPYVEIIPPGLKWKCNLCYKINNVEVPFQNSESFGGSFNSYDPFGESTGEYKISEGRVSKFDPIKNMKDNKVYDFPMLRNSLVDVKATSNYILKTPSNPIYLFIFEISYSTVSRGVFEISFKSVMENIKNMDEKVNIYMIFYNQQVFILKKNCKFFICSDFSEIPFFDSDNLIFKKNEILENYNNILLTVNEKFKESKSLKNDLGGALMISERILNSGGIITIFMGTLVNCGVGELENLGNDLKCKNNFYKELANRLSLHDISVNYFLFPQINMEMPSLLVLSRFTGGENYYFPNFNLKDDQYKNYIESEIGDFINKKLETEGLCKIRCSVGTSVKYFFGNFHLKSPDLLSICQLSPRHHISMEMDLKKYENENSVCIQIAHLRTVENTKRIKIINICIPVKKLTLKEFYHSINFEALIHFYSLKGANELIRTGSCTDFLHKQTVNFLRNYEYLTESKISSYANAELFVRLMNYLQKCVPLRPANTPVDYKSYYNYIIATSSPQIVSLIFKPQLLALHQNFKMVPLSLHYLETDGFYFLDSGLNCFFFISRDSNLNPLEFFNKNETGRINVKDPVILEFLTSYMSNRDFQPNYYLVIDDKKSVLGDVFFSYFYEDKCFGLMNVDDYIKKIRNEV